jgi:surface protein
MRGMFGSASVFNKPINDWNVSSVENMSYIFTFAKSFNQPLDKWNTSNVKNMKYMFHHANIFNQEVKMWDTGKAETMLMMFSNAKAFEHHNLSGWDVSNVSQHDDFFKDVGTGNTEPIW